MKRYAASPARLTPGTASLRCGRLVRWRTRSSKACIEENARLCWTSLLQKRARMTGARHDSVMSYVPTSPVISVVHRQCCDPGRCGDANCARSPEAVSYTHLTLPTSDL